MTDLKCYFGAKCHDSSAEARSDQAPSGAASAWVDSLMSHTPKRTEPPSGRQAPEEHVALSYEGEKQSLCEP